LAATLLPYVPRLAAEWDLDAAGQQWREIDASACFVDISGFTALSERLARRGRIGAEELTDVLNHVFSRMLSVAYDKGGGLLKFGGDALLLLFQADDHARLAAEAAVAMRAALREARTLPTSVGRLNLRMSVGVHSGSFHFFHVGDSHQELIVAGPAATTTTRMEQIADAGQIVVSADTAARLAQGAVGEPAGDGFLLRWRRVIEGGPGPRLAREVAPERIEKNVPIALRVHLREGERESEHRSAAIGFVKFQGIDDLLAAHGPDAAADALDGIVRAAQRAVADEDITLLASDLDANGGKLILGAGVPTARDDDEGRMLRAARAILDTPLALPVKIGVNRGHVFAGEIGAEFRRTFTVMGDTVNLAARLMAAATPGELYSTADVLDRSRSLFGAVALEPFFVKGKAQPVQAYSVGDASGVRDVETSTLPFVGRDDELERLREARERASRGAGTVVVIEGDRGAGKSRILGELTRDHPGTIIRVQGEAYATATPYLALRDPFRALFGIDHDDDAQAGAHLAAVVAAAAPSRAGLAPLLAPVFDVDIAATPESAAIAPEFRRDRLADLLIAMLSTLHPDLLVIVDDAQWVDDATRAVLEQVFAAASTRHWLAISARRPGLSGFVPAAADVAFTLAPINEETARDLVDHVTAAAPLRPHERDQLVSRAAGNPLFIEELLRVARSSDFDALPETLDAVATREIDALPPAARRVVRYASVLGIRFRPELLRELVGDVFDSTVRTRLENYLLLDHGHVRFRHALLQEAAYESLPFRQRVELHARAGDAIMRMPSPDTDADEALLSLHFFRAQEWEWAYKCSRLAASHAMEAFAPAETAIHLERALTSARRLGDVPSEDIADLLTALGAALIDLGVYEKADDAYRRASVAAQDDPVLRARIAERRSYVRGEHQGRLTAAVRHVRAGVALLDAAPGRGIDAERVRAQLLARLADLRLRQGNLTEAAQLCGEVMLQAERLGEQRALALAMTVLDHCMLNMGRSDEAVHMARALELYEELGDQRYVAIMLGNLGGVAFFESNWNEAADYFARAAEAARAAGDLATAAIADANLGELRVNQGHLADAETLLVPAVRTLESFEFRAAAASAMLHLGRAHVFSGDVETGQMIVDRATAILLDARWLGGALEARVRQAEVAAFAGRLDDAQDALAAGRELERTLGEPQFAPLADRIELTLAIANGDLDSAQGLVDAAVASALGANALYDVLLMLTLADRIGVGEHQQERQELSRRLGVVELAPLPPLVTDEDVAQGVEVLDLVDDGLRAVSGVGDVGELLEDRADRL
jgi:class 3 adenylate cyclase/tetratricopeptide (TPR) repeat protein